MSSPLDRIEADKLRDQLRDALNGRFVGGDVAWDLLNTWDALVNVAKAAEERRDAQIDATHYHIYDPACPCCIAQDKEWAALAALSRAEGADDPTGLGKEDSSL